MAISDELQSVNLWVKAEPFVNGILPIPPNPRLQAHYIKKLVSYARAKEKQSYPNMSYSIWRHVACNKLLLSEDLAWMYFTICELVSGDPRRLEWLSRYHNAETPEKLAEIRSRKTVNLYEFAILLYMQQLNIISLRSSLISAGDEWPTRSRTPSDGIATTQAAKHMDEHAQLSFIMTNLVELLELLVEPDSYSVGIGDPSLTLEAIEALNMILVGSMDKKKTPMPFLQILSQQKIQVKAGFSKLTRTYSVRQLAAWIKQRLGQNPFGVTCCISNGRRLSWLADVKSSGAKRGKLATNAHLVTRENSKGNKLIILSQVCKETLAKMSSTLENATVKIHRCHQSFLYLLSPLRTVSIEKCRNTTVVLGPVECAVHMTHCDDVTVIAVCHTLSLSYCQSCTVHVSTPCRPLVFNGNDNLVLAPFNTSYPQLKHHLQQVALATEPNLWNRPFSLGTDHSDGAAAPVVRLMSPSDFYIYTIPFHIETEIEPADSVAEVLPMGIPSGLPSDYCKSLKQREKMIEQWQKTVKSAGLTKEQRIQFQQLVEARFQSWLVESGCKAELDGLANLAKREKKNKS